MTSSYPSPKLKEGMPTPELMLPRYEAVRINEDGQRMYQTPEGQYYSVTTILSGSKDMSGITEWRESIGEKEAERILRVACARGDATHENIERWMLTGEEPKLNLLTGPYWKSISPWLKANIDKPLLIEGAIWNSQDRYAGTLDCIATLKEFGDEPILCDWKTSDSPKKPDRIYDYCLQCAAYVKAANYVYANLGLHIRQAKIVIAIADDTVQVETLDEDALNQLYTHFRARLSRFTK